MSFIERISDDFVKQYKRRVPPWGELGFITYKRTYARRVEGEGRTEEWHETIQRCVNGLLSIGGKLTKEEAEFLYDSVFNLKCSFSGRALWQLGTPTVAKLGGDSLQNCWALAVNDPIEPFCFAFNELMLGGGVGFNIQREVVYEIPKVKHDVNVIRKDEKDVDLIVPDNREGWVELLRRILDSFFVSGRNFSYSTICIRPKGALIKGFGGVASGPEDLCRGMEQVVKILKLRAGKKLRPVDCLDIMNLISSIVVAGNVRRAAALALGDADDREFLLAKDWSKGMIPNWRAMSNNSVACDKYDNLPEIFWKGYDGNGEPYGLINLHNCRRFGRLADGIDYRPDKDVITTNPCLTGDTLVALADGRGHLPIKQLAEEDKDVPVYCLNSSNNLAIRYMRHPRYTGHKKVFKLTLDDGSTIKVTENHKFRLSNGEEKEVKDLNVGDGLKILTKYEASIKDIFNDKSRSQDYWWLTLGAAKNISEHRLICEFSLGCKLKTGEVVHHKNKNGQDNSPSNLEVMSRKDHDNFHRLGMIGDNNPMRRAAREWNKEKWKDMSMAVSGDKNGRYCGEDNEALKQHALILCKQLGRRFSDTDWATYAKERGLPVNFSKWRRDHLGSVKGFATWAATTLELEPGLADLHATSCKKYQELLEEGYDCEVKDGEIIINKSCEICGKAFQTAIAGREHGTCSLSCADKKSWKNPGVKNKRILSMRENNNKRQEGLRNKQLAIFTRLQFELKRAPQKKEWVDACKNEGLSFEISRKTSPFRYWRELKKKATAFNHRIISIEPCEEEDVYNGTVDEFHNFFVGGWESKTKNNKRKLAYINNANCGELPAASGEACNLFEIFTPNIKDESEFLKIAEMALKATKTISTLPFINPKTNEIVGKNHRLGISITGFLQANHLRQPEIYDRIYKHLEKTDKEYSKVLGIKPSIKLTTVKPSGTASLLPGVTPGVHPAYSQHYIRRIRMAANDPLVELCRKHGYRVEPQVNFDGSHNMDTMIVEFPIKTPEGTVLAKDVSAVQQLEWQKWLQTHWADNSVSVTVYFKKEELPVIKEWLSKNYDDSVKSVSFLLHSEHGFRQAPYEEISEEKYKELRSQVKSITRIDDDQVRELAGSLECASGACPVR